MNKATKETPFKQKELLKKRSSNEYCIELNINSQECYDQIKQVLESGLQKQLSLQNYKKCRQFYM